MSICADNLAGLSKDTLNKAEAEDLLARARRLYTSELETGVSAEVALQRVESRLLAEAKTMELVAERNRLLALRAKRRVKEQIRRFPTLGEGLLALLEGSNKPIQGARFSVDYQSRSNFLKYFGRMIAGMDEDGVTKAFMNNEHQQDVYRELWELGKTGGRPGISGNETAQKIAKHIHDVGREAVARQNESGAYIRLLPGYVTRQTHDIERIRSLGGYGTSKESQTKSYTAWRDFILPLLDHDATFEGLDPEIVLRNVHQGIYSGFHGPDPDSLSVSALPYQGNHAGKVSRERVLHFRDADAAYKYNQQFGIKSLRDQVVGDLRFRGRSIALMENFGPAPKQLFDVIMGELHAEARVRQDAAKQAESLNDWRLEAAFNEISGHNDHPLNHSLARVANNTRMWLAMSKMGAVVLSSFGDKAFMQAEAAYQGISALNTLGAQITAFAKRSGDEVRALRLMGAAMDGLLGNVLGRYSPFRPVSGKLSWAQKRFFDINFMNWWNDGHKAAFAELMSAHLGEHAQLTHDKLPPDFQRLLKLYDIGDIEWETMRQSMWEVKEDGRRFLSPDRIADISPEAMTAYLAAYGKPSTFISRMRARTELETKLRTLLADRADFAVPSAGAAESRLMTMGTRAGTPLGEAVRLLMMFKAFPITILQKIGGRELYGRGAGNFLEWLMHDHKGKFQMAQLIAMTTIGGYLSGVVKDALKGRTPKPLVTDGKLNLATINDAMLRGGGLGIMGDILLQEYDRQGHSFVGTLAGPFFGQLDPVADIFTKLRSGENIVPETAKLVQGNIPYANLFYIRPVLEYLIFWNLQEAMKPGTLRRMEKKVEEGGQEFFVKPSEVVK